MSFTYTTADGAEVRRIERRLKAAGVRFDKNRTERQTFTDNELTVEVGAAEPWNIKVADKDADTLRAIIADKSLRADN